MRFAWGKGARSIPILEMLFRFIVALLCRCHCCLNYQQTNLPPNSLVSCAAPYLEIAVLTFSVSTSRGVVVVVDGTNWNSLLLLLLLFVVVMMGDTCGSEDSSSIGWEYGICSCLLVVVVVVVVVLVLLTVTFTPTFVPLVVVVVSSNETALSFRETSISALLIVGEESIEVDGDDGGDGGS